MTRIYNSFFRIHDRKGRITQNGPTGRDFISSARPHPNTVTPFVVDGGDKAIPISRSVGRLTDHLRASAGRRAKAEAQSTSLWMGKSRTLNVYPLRTDCKNATVSFFARRRTRLMVSARGERSGQGSVSHANVSPVEEALCGGLYPSVSAIVRLFSLSLVRRMMAWSGLTDRKGLLQFQLTNVLLSGQTDRLTLLTASAGHNVTVMSIVGGGGARSMDRIYNSDDTRSVGVAVVNSWN